MLVSRLHFNSSFFQLVSVILLAFVVSIESLFAVELQDMDTHFRISIPADKNDLVILSKAQNVELKTLNKDVYDKVLKELNKSVLSYKNYISNVVGSDTANQYSIRLKSKDDTVEAFSYFEENDSQYIVDFWINKEKVKARDREKKLLAKVQKPKVIEEKVELETSPAKDKKLTLKEKFDQETKEINATLASAQKSLLDHKKYRDFRYGAVFLADREALLPHVPEDINLDSKAPDFLYPIPDRELIEDRKEGHMQLTINLYREGKWGLMSKSMSLYEKKYGLDENQLLNDYIRANTLIKKRFYPTAWAQNREGREEFNKDFVIQSSSERVSALNYLENIAEKSEVSELRIACYRYLLQFARNRNDSVKSLDWAKKLYMLATETFNDPMTVYSSKVILNNLSRLGQDDKMKQFLKNKAVQRVMPGQIGLSYESYLLIKANKYKELITRYIELEETLEKPIEPSLLANLIEANFRYGNYNEVISLSDTYLATYPELAPSSRVRVTLALAYDLLDKPEDQTLTLYKDAINRSGDVAFSYEARVRYVGMRVARNKMLTEEDKEVTVFLNRNKVEKKLASSLFIQKMLWLVRMRTFMAQEKWATAMAYLELVDFNKLALVEKNIFIGDGAEIVTGLMKKYYLDQNYPKVVKTWEIYKNKYGLVNHPNPYAYYLAIDSYSRLQLKSSYQQNLDEFMNINANEIQTYPLWVRPHMDVSVEEFKIQLALDEAYRNSKWKKLAVLVANNQNDENLSGVSFEYYNALVNFYLKDYPLAIELAEDIITDSEAVKKLSPDRHYRLILTYIEALQEVEDTTKVIENALAVASDIEKKLAKKDIKDQKWIDSLTKILERVTYITAEALYAQGKKYQTLSLTCKKFLKEHSNSQFKERVKYLLGVALLKQNKTDQGKEVLEQIINNTEGVEYLKGLAKSELASLKIQNSNL